MANIHPYKGRGSSEALSSPHSPGKGDKKRVMITSLASITMSSPTSTSWQPDISPSPSMTSSPPSPARRALNRILKPFSPPPLPNLDDDDEDVVISDSISDHHGGLQSSIMQLTLEDSMDEQDDEQICCKQKEAKAVIAKLQKRADKHIQEGHLNDALSLLNKSLALQQKVYGKDHAKVGDTLNLIGEVLSNMGEDNRYMAMNSFEEALDIRMNIDPGSEDVATTVKNLWLLLHDVHSHDEDHKDTSTSGAQLMELYRNDYVCQRERALHLKQTSHNVAISSTDGDGKQTLTSFHDFDQGSRSGDSLRRSYVEQQMTRRMNQPKFLRLSQTQGPVY